jgi:hypothetical protein
VQKNTIIVFIHRRQKHLDIIYVTSMDLVFVCMYIYIYIYIFKKLLPEKGVSETLCFNKIEADGQKLNNLT